MTKHKFKVGDELIKKAFPDDGNVKTVSELIVGEGLATSYNFEDGTWGFEHDYMLTSKAPLPKVSNRADVLDILTQYLEHHDCHGLVNEDQGCSCLIDNLAQDCGHIRPDCTAGWMTPCTCGDHDYHLSSTRPGKNLAPLQKALHTPWGAVRLAPQSSLSASEHCKQTQQRNCHCCDDLSCISNEEHAR